MPVGELFLSAFLSVLFDRLTSFELLQFLRQEGLYSKIKKWETTLRMIQAVLGDAEDRQLTNEAVKIWLDDLRDLVYDVEDVLDEFATEALARKSKMEEHDQQASTSKVRKLLPVRFGNWSPRAIKFNRSMESAIRNVTSRLEGLCRLREELGLRGIAGGISSSTAAVYQRPPTTSLPTGAAVYGRDQDKAKVIEMVLKDEPRVANFRVIPIVGMGGIGKTTLAREVYNDNQMMDFKPRAWVCISEDFDVLRISNAILGSMTSSSCDYKDLNIVQSKLKEVLIGKKFLIVLDDVWSKDYSLWESLKTPFMAGAQGSKIIVTTRLAEVASMMNPVLRCPNIVCFPEGGLPNTNLSVLIADCEKLEALPSGFHCLDSLRRLCIYRCSSIKSFTEKGFPTNLTSLEIGNHNMYKALVEWGLHKLTSLTELQIVDCPDEELGVQLPPTLTHLYITRFPNLKCLSSKGFQNLTCLEWLEIDDCPNLTSFPKQGLPSSLLDLQIRGCPLLKKECKRNKGKEWSKISHIPNVEVDWRSIYDPGEEDLP